VRIFVTGATGFIGRHLCEALIRRGDEVTGMVRSPARDALLPGGARVFRGDLGKLADPGVELPECDVVVHLAGVVCSRRRLPRPVPRRTGKR
jgi:NADH dehydrogenase